MDGLNTKNERLKRAYIEHRRDLGQKAEATLRADEKAIRRFEAHTGLADLASFDKKQAMSFREALASAVQLVLTLLLLGLCFFIPMNDRVMRLENSHRTFRVTMWDVAQAYQAAHAADRDGCFSLKSEFDSVRERLEHLRRHPDLEKLEPEILEMAAQMSHESPELAEIYSTERVERARQILRRRQEEADVMMERVRSASIACREIKGWLERVEIEEDRARSELGRLKEELEPLLDALELSPVGAPRSNVEVFSQRAFAAE